MESERSKREHDIEIKRLELQFYAMREQHPHNYTPFHVTKHIRFVPVFDEGDADSCFLHLEKYEYL